MTLATLFTQFPAGVVHAPVLWIIGIVLIVAGVVGLIRGSLIFGIILIIIGIIIGGLNIL